MADQKDNLAVFKNTRKLDPENADKSENWPDYNVVLSVGGEDFEAGLWIRESESGVKYMSGLIKPKWIKGGGERKTEQAKPESDESFDEDIPF